MAQHFATLQLEHNLLNYRNQYSNRTLKNTPLYHLNDIHQFV